jgi:Zn-dependent alcohol dehydrogenase
MPRTTTALVVPELNGKFELREIQLDDMQPNEVLVEIHASGLCHTDLSFATGVLPCERNAVLGHEGAYHSFRDCHASYPPFCITTTESSMSS